MVGSGVRRSLTLEDVYAIPVPSDPQLAPDGSRLAFVVSVADRDSDDDRSTLWEVPVSGGPPRQLTRAGSCTAPCWSPDGRWLAFLRESDLVADGTPQLWLLPQTGEARQLTELPKGAGAPVWSPDGTWLAFTAPVDRPDIPAADEQPVVCRRLDEKADGVGLLRGRRQHLHVVRCEDGEVRQLTTGDFSVSAPVWSPDGTELAVTTARHDDRDLVPAAAAHVVPLTGGEPRRVTPADGMFRVAAFSPDGRTLLLVGQRRAAVGHDRLFTVSTGGGEVIPLTPGYDRNVMVGSCAYPGARPRFDPDGSQVFFCARDRGCVHVMSVSATGGQPSLVLGGDRVVGGLSLAGERLAAVVATAESPGELFVADLDGGDERQLTELFHDALPDVRLATPRQRTFTARNGTQLHGWVMRADDTTGPTPLLLDVHGGPHNAWGPAFDGAHLYQQTLVAAGWTVLCLNPRGSDGYGEHFWRAVIGGWGRNDEADFLAAVDALVADGLADPERLAVAGYSYGGFMACWLSANSDRFAAAVAGGCVSDLVSFVGTADDGWMTALFELGADRRTLAEASPLSHVDNVRSPTLLLHGEQDHTCPIGQAEEWFTALRGRRIPVELVRYPSASHTFVFDGRPSYRVDYNRRLHDWVRRHTGGAAATHLTRTEWTRWQHRLDELVRRHQVPGASLAVLADGEVLAAASGVLNVGSGVAATPDSVFQIGSITKVYTTSLVMQLVDEGKVDLDEPVVNLLDEFVLADPDATKQVTVRQLLNHTSGIEGDHFVDTGRGDDALARYLATCAELGLCHPVGATMSYCNTGFVVAGRLVERLTGLTWHEAMRDRLFQPLGLSATTTLPEQAMRFRVAFGHDVDDDDRPRLASIWMLPYSSAPAGSTTCATASDLVAFAKMHLDGGLAADGTRVLSADAVAAMQRREVAIPDPWTLGSHWGLGWILFDWNGRRVVGHDGGTIGQASFLRIVPDAGVAVALLTNGGHAQDLYQELFGELLAELCDVRMPAMLAPPADPVPFDPARYVGTYERVGVRIELTDCEGGLVGKLTATGPLAELVDEPIPELKLLPVADDLFVGRSDRERTWTPAVFFTLPNGGRYLHMGARATPKVGGQAP